MVVDHFTVLNIYPSTYDHVQARHYTNKLKTARCNHRISQMGFLWRQIPPHTRLTINACNRFVPKHIQQTEEREERHWRALCLPTDPIWYLNLTIKHPPHEQLQINTCNGFAAKYTQATNERKRAKQWMTLFLPTIPFDFSNLNIKHPLHMYTCTLVHPEASNGSNSTQETRLLCLPSFKSLALHTSP